MTAPAPEFPHPATVLRNDTLTCDLRDKVLRSEGRQGFADTTATKYSGTGHAVEFDFAVPALHELGLPARVITKERIKLDTFGNSYSLFDSTNERSSGGSHATTLARTLTFELGTGRLTASSRSGRTDAYEYDEAGSTVFFWQSYQDGDPGRVLENRASFYDMDGPLAGR